MYKFSALLKPSLALLFCLVSFGQQVPSGPPPGVIQDPGRPSQSQKKDDKSSADTSAAAAGASVDVDTYKVGPGDVLNVRVWNEEKISGPVVVQQNGKITLPLVGDIDAGGFTPKEIQQKITEALGKLYVKPVVTTTVQSVESKKYYLDGMVNHPGEFVLATPTTVLEAISKAGGVQDFANKKKIYILRGDKKIPFNLKDVLNGKNIEQNVKLEPGDHVIVP